ncbi:MAG: hypothetical protein HYR80_04130 [Nitrospirae bacterium]|nr:hypothetical protein [Nitrospirota bacterium]
MRYLKTIFFIAIFLLGDLPLIGGQSYRDETPNSFKIYKDLLDRISKEDTPINSEQMEKYLFLMDPLITGLGQKTHIVIKESFKESIADNNRKLIRTQVIRLILLDTQDLIDLIGQENGNWKNAKRFALRAALNYQLIMEFLQKKHPALDEKIKTGFKNLEFTFSNLDLTSSPNKPDQDKKFLIENLSMMREAIEKE